MEDLSRNSAICGNVPGYVGIWITSSREVLKVSATNDHKRSVSFSPGGSWGFIDGAKRIYLSDIQQDGIRNVEVGCDFAATPAVMDHRLREMSEQRFIVKLKDRNGKFWLVGSDKEPLHFSYDHIGEPDASGAHKYVLKFYRLLSIPLYETD